MAHSHKPSVDSEMHELNAEADLLEQKTTVVPVGVNGEDIKLQSHSTDPDAQAMVVESLRAQVQDLFTQVTQLNNKLVRSYDRVSDLEDELHVTSANLRQSTLKVSQLELERTQHLSALSTGLLVEKSHVTAELTRLMEKATEEAARRGQAESARAEIEKDLDDLSAGLFDQANTMVAKARIAEARSARKLEETEAALKSAEEVVGALQAQMQALQSEKEAADRRMEEMRVRMGKGKWVDRSPEGGRFARPRLLSSHVPYHEFLIFVSHLRAIRPALPQPPAMSSLLPLPFLARLVAEDSDPTVRLDLAPSLNWLSRRSVLAAIHSGQLNIEPIQFTTLLEELAPPNIPASSHHTHVACALCGMPIYSSSDSPASTPTTPNARSGTQSASWSTTLFKNVRAGEINLPTALTGHNRHSAQFAPAATEPPSQLYIFRLEATSSSLPVSLPISSQQPGTPARQSIYPLCTNGWCLSRLRTTCSLWAFVRTSIVEKIWEEPPTTAQLNGSAKPGVNGVDHKHDAINGTTGDGKQTIMQPPPRRTKMGLGSLWGSMQRSLSGTREPEKEREVSKEDGRPKLPPRDPSRKALPPAPPSHPSVSHASRGSVTAVHRVPPPFKESTPASTPPPVSTPPIPAVPPPLPKRNRERETRSATPEPEPKAGADGVPDGEMHEPPKSDIPTGESAKEESSAAVAEPVAETQDESSTAKDEEPPAQVATITEEAPKEPKPELVVPPPSVSRATSNDSFSTPTEELAPPLHASPGASAASLVPSEETATVTATVAEDAPATDPAPAAEPAASEAPTATSETTTAPNAPSPLARDDRPPSRTGSPVPPPLPRRAAARARSSVLIPQGGEPAPLTSVDGVPSPAEGGASTGSQEAPAPGPAEAAVVVTEEPEQIAEAAKDESVAGGEVPATEVPVQEAPEAASGPAPETAAPKVSEEESQVNGDAIPDAEDAASDAVPPTDSVGSEEKEEGSVAEEGAAEEEDNGQYVGEATWEERTYKELVRLREEMFWARVGAVMH